MRVNFFLIFLAVTMTGCAETPQPKGTAPVLDSITFHKVLERYTVIYPEFNFHSADGNVVAIHREIVSSNKPDGHLNFNPDATIHISADQQRKGATYVGGWPCGPETYVVTLQAYLTDENGNRSNVMKYAIPCNGIE